MAIRKIKPKTLPEIFIDARQRKNISLDQIAKELKIPFCYLESLESGKLNDLPGRDQAKQIMKNYCHYLGINFSACWQVAKKNHNFSGTSGKVILGQKHFTSWPGLIRRVLVIGAVLAVVVFFGLKVRQIFAPPILEISSPLDGSIVSDRQIKILGQSEPEVDLLINNKEIFVDEWGYFETMVDLQSGLNLFKITAQKRYSRINEKGIRVLFKE